MSSLTEQCQVHAHSTISSTNHHNGKKMSIFVDRRQTSCTWTRIERHRWLCQLTLGTCLLYASRISVPLVAPAIATQYHWNKTEAGTVLSSFFWGYFLTQIVAGNLSDRWGGDRVLMLAALGWSLCTLAVPCVLQCYSYPMSSLLIVLRVVHGMFQGFHYPALSSLSSRRLGEYERGPFVSAVSTGSALGAVLAGTAGSAFLAFCGWPAIFHFIGLCGLVWMLSLKLTVMRLKENTEKCNWIALPSDFDKVKDIELNRKIIDTPHWTAILFTKAFWSCAVAHACQNNCLYIMLSWMPTYFQDADFPDAKDWVFNVIPWAFIVPATFLGREMSERLLSRGYSVTATRKIIESICLLLQALGLVLISSMESFSSAVMCATVVLAASGFHHNAVFVNPQDLAPRHAGSVFGLMNTIGSIPGFLGVQFAGYILEMTNKWSNVFVTTAFINIVGCIIYVLYGCGERII